MILHDLTFHFTLNFPSNDSRMCVCATGLSGKLFFFQEHMVSKRFAFKSSFNNDRKTNCALSCLEAAAAHRMVSKCTPCTREQAQVVFLSLVLRLHTMTLYKYVQKFSKEKQKLESFHHLRVAGLAYEVG